MKIEINMINTLVLLIPKESWDYFRAKDNLFRSSCILPGICCSAILSISRIPIFYFLLNPLSRLMLNIPKRNHIKHPDNGDAQIKVTHGGYDMLKVGTQKQRKLGREEKKVQKFSEELWKAIVSSIVFGYCVIYCSGSQYFLSDWWQGWPNQTVEQSTHNLLVMELAFYIHFTVFFFLETRRKDFWEMLTHHIVAILLCSFSSVLNLTRLIPFVIMLYESSTALMSIAKLCVYMQKVYPFMKHVADALFLSFVVLWHYAHFYLQPKHIFRSLAKEVPQILGQSPSYWIFCFCFAMLFCLHLRWALAIWKVIYNLLVDGEVNDVRSEDEDGDKDGSVVQPSSNAKPKTS